MELISLAENKYKYLTAAFQDTTVWTTPAVTSTDKTSTYQTLDTAKFKEKFKALLLADPASDLKKFC